MMTHPMRRVPILLLAATPLAVGIATGKAAKRSHYEGAPGGKVELERVRSTGRSFRDAVPWLSSADTICYYLSQHLWWPPG